MEGIDIEYDSNSINPVINEKYECHSYVSHKNEQYECDSHAHMFLILKNI